MAGAPLGNTNAIKAKPWAEALRYELERYEPTDKKAGLRRIAQRVIQSALQGDHNAITEIANRMDGKPVQAIVGEDDGPVRMVIVWEGQDKPT